MRIARFSFSPNAAVARGFSRLPPQIYYQAIDPYRVSTLLRFIRDKIPHKHRKAHRSLNISDAGHLFVDTRKNHFRVSFWCRREGTILRPRAYESRALTN